MGICSVVHQPWTHLEFSNALSNPAAILNAWPKTGWKDGRLYRKFQRIEEDWLLAELSELGSWLCGLLQMDADKYYPVALLVEDAPGYRIRPHTDCAGKVLSSQIYLAEDDEHEEFGVTLLGDPERQIPYRMNSGYAFKVSPLTWHEVKPCDGGRKSLQLIYYDTPNPNL